MANLQRSLKEEILKNETLVIQNEMLQEQASPRDRDLGDKMKTHKINS
jgi:hypothetical protein